MTSEAVLILREMPGSPYEELQRSTFALISSTINRISLS